MKRFITLLTASAATLLVLSPIAASAVSPQHVTIQLLNADGTARSSLPFTTANDGAGAVIAAADLGTDGIPEILVANGIGNEPRISVYRQDGTLLGSFLAYASDMGTGITMATCDLDGDGTNEIITGTQYGGGPQVRIFDHMGRALGPGFYAYDQSFRGGVNVSCGDLDGDGKAEIVTGAGLSGGPHVRVWKSDGTNWTLSQEFFPFDASTATGVLVHVEKNGTLAIATENGSPTEVKTYVIHSSVTQQTDASLDAGAPGASALFDANGKLFVSFLNTQSVQSVDGSVHLSVSSETGTSDVVGADLDHNGTDELVAIEGRPSAGPTGDKYILVDLSEQRLYAYENGILANTFLVSTAKAPFETPLGIHHVLAKKPIVDYTWNYGAGSPYNFSLGPTPWNLEYEPHLYIHDAWWHNNFGHPMSHGCINANLLDSKWIYDFADVGTTVDVQA